MLREDLGLTGAKDGCSPQGQCGCCTVLVDGAPRVACVTPARRVHGREITTVEGLDADVAAAWADAFCAVGASQCGFCTPGIVMRLEGQQPADCAPALLGHLCRCTGWQTIGEAWELRSAARPVSKDRDLAKASARATIEGGVSQVIDPAVVLGRGGCFGADTAPAGALRAVLDGAGDWVVAPTLAEARRAAAKTQGRRTTLPAGWPLEVPDGDWLVRLQTTWVEPAYLETDASWCLPGGEPSSPVGNGGAFGAKALGGPTRSPVMEAARHLADLHGVPVLASLSREDSVRSGPKRPPVAAGIDADGHGLLRVVATPGIVAAVASVAPGLGVEEVVVPGPPTSTAIRGAGWVEAAVLMAAATALQRSQPSDRSVTLRAPNGAEATAAYDRGAGPGTIFVEVGCGEPLDIVMLRSYCIGAAHMAYSWVTSESLAVDAAGQVNDLTIRSFGIVRAIDMPHVDVVVRHESTTPINGSDAVFAAVAAAVWLEAGLVPRWPTSDKISS